MFGRFALGEVVENKIAKLWYCKELIGSLEVLLAIDRGDDIRDLDPSLRRAPIKERAAPRLAVMVRESAVLGDVVRGFDIADLINSDLDYACECAVRVICGWDHHKSIGK